MKNEVDFKYIEEKRGMAINAIDRACESLRMALTLANTIASQNVVPYEAGQLYEQLDEAEAAIVGARLDLEKVFWATGGKEIGFEEWLRGRGFSRLIA